MRPRTPLQYLRRMALTDQLFPALEHRLEGFMKLNVQLRIVISQRFIEPVATTPRAISDFFYRGGVRATACGSSVSCRGQRSRLRCKFDEPVGIHRTLVPDRHSAGASPRKHAGTNSRGSSDYIPVSIVSQFLYRTLFRPREKRVNSLQSENFSLLAIYW